MTTIVAVELGGTGANNTADARAALGVISSTVSNAAYIQANSAYGQANLAYTQANSAYSQSNNAYTQANNSYGQANSAYAQANLGYNQANTATTNAGNAHNQANNAYGQANLAYTQANSAYTQANNSYGQANLAYDAANTKFSLTGGSITGNVTINGNLTVQGNATTINVSNLSVNDSIILLATNQVGDSNDIGFVGHFDRGATATHAGIIRKASQNQFYLFDNYEVEPTNNVIDVTGNNFRVGNLRLGIINADSFVTTSGLNVTNQANNAYAQANLAYTAANNRVLKAGDTMTGRLGISNTTDNVVTSGIILTGNRNYLAGDNGGIQIIATGSGGTIGIHDYGAIKFYARGFTGSGDGGGGIVSLHVGGGSSNTTSNGMFIQADGTITQGTQNVKFYTGSSATERMRIDSSGNVGIGTASPVTRLHVLDALSGGQFIVANSETNAAEKYGTFATQHYTNAQSPALGMAVQSNSTDNNILIGGALGEFNAATTVRFYTAANNTTVTGTERMRIDSSGNIGVGTTSIAAKLHVHNTTYGTGTVASLWQYSGSASSPTEVSDWPYPVLSLRSVGNFYLQTMLSFGLSNDADYKTDDSVWNFRLNGVTVSGWDNNSNTTPSIASSANVGLQLLGPGNLRLGTVNSKNIYFRTNNSDVATIDGSGNVGIGTNVPGTRLEAYVAGGGPIIRAASDATGGGAGNGFHIGLDGSAGAYLSQNENAPLYFYTNATEKMILTAAGNLGIAVSSPAHRLQLGTTSSVSTATPETISLGGTYSSSAGGNAKLRVWTDGTNVMGLGVSSNQLDFICSGAYSHVFYTNGSERARIPSGGGFSVGTTSSPGAGAIYATGEITAFFSDDRLKNRLRNIDNALSKVLTLNGFYYEPNETAMGLGYEKKKQVGVSAQEVQEVLPEVVVAAPIDAEYMTVHYHKLVPLLIEAIKELNTKIEDMQKIIESKS